MTLSELLIKEVEPGDVVIIRHGCLRDTFYVKTLQELETSLAGLYLLNGSVKTYKTKQDKHTFRKKILIKM